MQVRCRVASLLCPSLGVHTLHEQPQDDQALDMHANIVAARVRSNNQLATKSGFARTNGGYI
jgi:hypothetical protein